MRWLRAIRSDPRIDSVAREHAVWRVLLVSQAAHRVAEFARNSMHPACSIFRLCVTLNARSCRLATSWPRVKGKSLQLDQLLQSAGWWVDDYAGNAAVEAVRAASIRSHGG